MLSRKKSNNHGVFQDHAEFLKQFNLARLRVGPGDKLSGSRSSLSHFWKLWEPGFRIPGSGMRLHYLTDSASASYAAKALAKPALAFVSSLQTASKDARPIQCGRVCGIRVFRMVSASISALVFTPGRILIMEPAASSFPMSVGSCYSWLTSSVSGLP